MISALLIAGNLFTVIGIASVGYGFAQDNLTKVSMGFLACLLGISLLYSAVSKKLNKQHKTYLISNGIYASLGLLFGLISLGTDEKLIIRTMAASIIAVSAITLNIANFDKHL